MTQNDDHKWRELLATFLFDLDAYLPLFASFAPLLKMYLEDLKQQGQLKTFVHPVTQQEIEGELILYMIRAIEMHAQNLIELRQNYRAEISASRAKDPDIQITLRDPESEKTLLEDIRAELQTQTLRIEGYVTLLEMHLNQQDDAANIFNLTNATPQSTLVEIRQSLETLARLEKPLARVRMMIDANDGG